MEESNDVKTAYSSAKGDFAKFCSEFRDKTQSCDDCTALENERDQLDSLYDEFIKGYEMYCTTFDEQLEHCAEFDIESLKKDYENAVNEYRSHVERLKATKPIEEDDYKSHAEHSQETKLIEEGDTVSTASFSHQLYQLSSQIEALSNNSQRMQKELGSNIHELQKTMDETNVKLDHMITKEELTDRLTELSTKVDGEIGDVKEQLELVKQDVTRIQEKMLKDVTGLTDALRSEFGGVI